jgi:hypothetical protein
MLMLPSQSGGYTTPQQMREEVHLVWKNCLVFNGHDNAIYLDCKKLADRFDNEFRARIRAPRHREILSLASACLLRTVP